MSVTRREAAWSLLAALAVSGGAVVLAWSQGALGIARNDDWSFIHNAFAFHDSGVFAVTGWVQMMLIGQLVLSYPVLAIAGHSITALQLVTAGLGALLLWAGYLLVRGFLARPWAVLASASLAIGPLYGSLAASVMTDVPAAAFQVLALAVAARALQSNAERAGTSRAWLMVASVFGLVGFSIREYSIAALAVIWLLAVVGRHRYGLTPRFIVTWTIGLGAVGVALLLWRAGQLTSTDSPLGLNALALVYMSRLPLTFGFLLLPVTAFVNPVRAWRAAWRSSRWLTVTLMLVITALTLHTRFEFVGNYWAMDGGYTAVLRGVAPSAVPTWLWFLVVVASVLSMTTITALTITGVVEAARRVRLLGARAWVAGDVVPHAGPSLAVGFVVVNGVMFSVLPTIALIPVFDRYLVPVVVPAAGIVAWLAVRAGVVGSRAWRTVGILGLGVFALASLLVVVNTAALDGARWRLAAQVADRYAIAPGNVDGGFDWFALQTDGSPRPAGWGPRWNWWTTSQGDRAVCATLLYADHPADPDAAGPAPDLAPLMTASVPTWLGVPRTLVVLPGPDACTGVTP